MWNCLNRRKIALKSNSKWFKALVFWDWSLIMSACLWTEKVLYLPRGTFFLLFFLLLTVDVGFQIRTFQWEFDVFVRRKLCGLLMPSQPLSWLLFPFCCGLTAFNITADSALPLLRRSPFIFPLNSPFPKQLSEFVSLLVNGCLLTLKGQKCVTSPPF